MTTLPELKTAYEAAQVKARLPGATAADREAAKAAWLAYDAAAPRIKRTGFASRAGKRHGQITHFRETR